MSIINTENTNFTYETANFSIGIRVIQEAYQSHGQYSSTPILTVSTKSSSEASTLSNYFQALNESVIHQSGSQLSALFTRTPRKSTTKGVALKLLSDHGMDYSKRRFTDYLLTSLIAKYINDHQVKALFIDEVQHLTHERSPSHINQVADWLKNLADVTNTLLIVGGSDQSLRDLESNEQFQRRIGARI